MAKKKNEPIEEIKAKEVMMDSVEEEKVQVDKTEEFIARQLMAINRMPNRAKAQRLAERVLRNRK